MHLRHSVVLPVCQISRYSSLSYDNNTLLFGMTDFQLQWETEYLRKASFPVTFAVASCCNKKGICPVRNLFSLFIKVLFGRSGPMQKRKLVQLDHMQIICI